MHSKSQEGYKIEFTVILSEIQGRREWQKALQFLINYTLLSYLNIFTSRYHIHNFFVSFPIPPPAVKGPTHKVSILFSKHPEHIYNLKLPLYFYNLTHSETLDKIHM